VGSVGDRSVETVLKSIELGQEEERMMDETFYPSFPSLGRGPGIGIDLGRLVIVAHRNPETNTFFFGEDELSALEDVLGQFIGYFCAALRSSPDQAHQTEPLSITVLQEA
jgi:hypothetical protein